MGPGTIIGAVLDGSSELPTSSELPATPVLKIPAAFKGTTIIIEIIPNTNITTKVQNTHGGQLDQVLFLVFFAPNLELKLKLSNIPFCLFIKEGGILPLINTFRFNPVYQA